MPSPKIPLDGKTLFLDAMPLDTIEQEILGDYFMHKSKVSPLVRFLEVMTGLPCSYPVSDETTFDAVATALASCLPPFSASNKGEKATDDETADQSSSSLPPEQRARIWLCEVIDREVRHWVTTLRNDLESLTGTSVLVAKQRGTEEEKQKHLEDLISVYQKLHRKFDNLPWRRTEDQGLADLPLTAPSDDEWPETQEKANTMKGRLSSQLTLGLEKISKRVNADQNSLSEWTRKKPVSPGAQRYEKAICSALAWRILFRTRDGLIGMGPSWLSKGDRVILVRGAIVPYVFRHVDEDLKLQLGKVKEKLEKEEKRVSDLKQSTSKSSRERAARLQEKIPGLRRNVDVLQAQVGRKDAWVLIGEAYVEGFMRGEALERGGADSFDRMGIV